MALCHSLHKHKVKLFVTGPQRSGTTFVSHCLAEAHGLKHIDEMEFDVYFLDWFLEIVKPLDNWVVHAPGLFSEILKIQNEIPEVTFVVVKRDIDEIQKSAKRINLDWSTEKTKLNIAEANKQNVAEIKYKYWEKWKKYLKSWVEYHYADFELHPLWLESKNRENFGPKQWRQTQKDDI